MFCLNQIRLLLYTNFMKEKKCQKLQKYLAVSGLQPLAARELEGCTNGVGEVTGWPGLRGVLGRQVMQVRGLSTALGSPESTGSRWTFPRAHTRPQCVVSGGA